MNELVKFNELYTYISICKTSHHITLNGVCVKYECDRNDFWMFLMTLLRLILFYFIFLQFLSFFSLHVYSVCSMFCIKFSVFVLQIKILGFLNCWWNIFFYLFISPCVCVKCVCVCIYIFFTLNNKQCNRVNRVREDHQGPQESVRITHICLDVIYKWMNRMNRDETRRDETI